MDFPVVDVQATGKRIRELRKARGISVREIQVCLGLNAPQAVYNWQRGKSLPSIDLLILLSKIFGVPMEEILVIKNKETC